MNEQKRKHGTVDQLRRCIAGVERDVEDRRMAKLFERSIAAEAEQLAERREALATLKRLGEL